MGDLLAEISILQRKVAELDKALNKVARHRWATVVTAAPLSVRVDGSETVIHCPDASLIGPLKNGQRVIVRLSGTQLHVTGPAPRPVPANTVRIGGVDYPASGSLGVVVGSWAYVWPNSAGQTLQIPFPCDLPDGWTFEFFTLATSGFTEVHTGEVKRDVRRVYCRVVQHGSHALSALTRVGWRLVKE